MSKSEMTGATQRLAERLLGEGREWMTKSAAIAMRHYEAGAAVMQKADSTPLTEADLEVDAYLYTVLQAAFPDIPIVTEERARTHRLAKRAAPFFLVDPIDGTREFIHRRGEFTVNIALIENTAPVAGLVCAPALGRCFAGAIGGNASEFDLHSGSDKPLIPRPADNDALAVVASRSHQTEETRAFIDANPVAAVKNAGSSLKFCLLAAGEADLYPRFGPTMEWDTAAGHAVLAAAGGHVETLDGEPLGYGKDGFKNPWFIARTEGVRFGLGDAANKAASIG